MTLSQSFKQRVFDTPSVAKTMANVIRADIEVLAKRSNATGDPSDGENIIRPRVPLLFFACRPFAVAGFVIAVVILSFDTHACGALTHVGKKIIEHAPAVTDCNPAATIGRITRVVRIETSLNHGPPAVIRGSLDAVSIVAMPTFPAGSRSAVETPAGFYSADFKRPIRDLLLSTTIAGTNALCRTFGVNVRNDFELSKLLTDERDSFRHIVASFNVVLSGGYPATTGTRCDSHRNAVVEQV